MFCKGFLVISHCIARMVPRWQRRGQGFQLYTYAALTKELRREFTYYNSAKILLTYKCLSLSSILSLPNTNTPLIFVVTQS